jgi:glutamine amidotransferase
VAGETIATASYGETFSAAVERGNIYGCQFHPERSSEVGARILKNFLAISCS